MLAAGNHGSKNRTIYVECLLLVVVIYGLIYTASFLISSGYLPQPFYYGSQSYFTDWSVSAYFAHNKGAYTTFASVYPPLSFVFLRIFSLKSCYVPFDDIFASRECDWLGPATLYVFFLINIPLTFTSYRLIDRRTALIRTLTICVGLPSVYALERGNLIVPCFTCFILGNSKVLRSARLKWLFQALAINFKPYLIMGLAGPLLRRRWRWLEGCGIMGLIIYIVTYALEGGGSPIEVLTNIGLFATQSAQGTFERAIYASSYKPVTDLLASDFPLMHFIGSTPMEVLEIVLPLVVGTAKAAILVCFGLTLLRPAIVPVSRLAALGISWVLISEDPGGYAILFLLYLVFMERWRGALLGSALVVAYLLSVPLDYMVVKVSHQILLSYLTNREVGYDLGINVGELIRPALVLILTYLLAAKSILDVVGSLRSARARGFRPQSIASPA